MRCGVWKSNTHEHGRIKCYPPESNSDFFLVGRTNSWWMCSSKTMIFCWASSTQRVGLRSRILSITLGVIEATYLRPSYKTVSFFFFPCILKNSSSNRFWITQLRKEQVVPWFHRHRYLDDSMRIGRDDKGNLFILERSEATWHSTSYQLKAHYKYFMTNIQRLYNFLSFLSNF